MNKILGLCVDCDNLPLDKLCANHKSKNKIPGICKECDGLPANQVCDAHYDHQSLKKPNVDHPEYYNKHNIEVIDFVEEWFLDRPHEFTAVIYISRAPHKNDGADEIEDLEKAVWYLQRKIQKLKVEKGSGFQNISETHEISKHVD